MTDSRNEYDDLLTPKPKAGNPRTGELLGKYDRYLADEDSRRAQAHILTAPAADEAAKANRIARQVGVPAALVDGQANEYERTIRQRDIAQASAAHPRLANFLADPRAAAVAQDDVPTLATISDNFNKFWAKKPAPQKTWLQRARDFAVNLPSNVGSAAYAGTIGLARGVTDVATAGVDIARELDITAPLQRKLFGTTLLDQAQQGLKTYSAYQGRAQEAARPDYASMPFVERNLIQGFENVPSSAAALGLTIAGAPQAGLGLLGATTGGQSYREGKEAGLSTGAAATFALSQGAIEVATEKIPVMKFLHDTQVGTPFFKRLAKNLASEQIGEQAATALQDLNQWAAIDVNKGKTFGDYLRERPEAAAATALAVTSSVGATNIAVGAVEKISSKIAKAVDARESAATLTGIMDTAAKSKLRERDPEHFRQFVDKMAEGSPAENVYLPVEAVDTFMQGENFSDESGFFAGIASQLEEARATGGDVVVPLADVASKLAGTPAWEALKDDARVNAGGWSVKEAVEQGDETTEALDKRGEEIASAVFEQAAQDEPAVQVFTQVRDELRAAGFTADAATKQAQLFAASREAWGARMGMTALEYHQANPVEFRRGGAGPTVGASAVMDQPPIRANVPNVRGGWTTAKVLKYLKGYGGRTDHSRRSAATEIAKYETPDELMANIFYHGSQSYISDGIKAGAVFRDIETRGGGGYGNVQHSISISASRNTASNFTANARSGTVYPVLLKKGAVVIERPDLQDADDVEDHLTELWAQGVDAVKIGDHTKEHSEQEVVVLNPRALVKLRGDTFQVFGKPKFENLGEQDIRGRITDPSTLNQDAVEFRRGGAGPTVGASAVMDQAGKLTAFHGTDAVFDTFDIAAPRSTGTNAPAVFFTKSKTSAQTYGENVIEAELGIEEPVTFDFGGKSTVFFDGKHRTPSQLVSRIAEIRNEGVDSESDLRGELEDAGWDYINDNIDGVILENINDNGGVSDEVTTHYAVFDTSLISRYSQSAIEASVGVASRLPGEHRTVIDGADITYTVSPDARAIEINSIDLPDDGTLSRDDAIARFVEGAAANGQEVSYQGRRILEQGQARGQIALYPDRSVITLFENSDLSTLIHETGHLFLEELSRNATSANAPDDVKADWATIQKWFAENKVPMVLQQEGPSLDDRLKVVAEKGAFPFDQLKKNFDEWVKRDGEPEAMRLLVAKEKELGIRLRKSKTTGEVIPREAHELFARGFERYAMEGKAPSSQLQAAFTTFRSWLLRIYQVVQNLRSPINAEVREVFDRMLATQDAIDSYADEQSAKTLTGIDKLMNDAEFDAYQKTVAKARTEAFDALLYRTMERIRVRRQPEFNEASRAIRRDATEAVLGEPRFRALRLLRTGKIDEQTGLDIKLDSDWLAERYGADAVDRLPQGIPIYRKGGTDADEIAAMTGFNSGAELVEALFNVQRQQSILRAAGDKRQLRAKLIDDATNAAIEADNLRDPLTDGTLEEEAVAAIENERHGEVIASENRALARRTGTRATPYKLAREWAKRKIAAGKVVDVASRSAMQRYARAAAKAARLAETAMLEQNIDEAFRQKQAQLLNHALLSEAKIAADETDRIVARLNKLAKRAAMKSVDQDYFDRVHELLERYSFRPASQRWLDEVTSFREWAAAQSARGFEVSVPERLNDERQHYSRVSVEELYGLGDTVDSLMALGRHKQKLLDAKDERDFADVIKRMLGKMRELPLRKLPKTSTSDNSFRRTIRQRIAGGIKISSIALDLDHQDQNGPMMNLLVHRANDASLTRTRLREKTLQPLADRMSKFSGKQWKRFKELVTIPELSLVTGLSPDDPRLGQPLTLTRLELIGVALNTGNASNFEKMTRGERWNPQALREILDRELSAEDWQFVQAAWDSVETLWPAIVATERQLSGVVPEKVEPTPITTRHGTFAGGYWPVVYDSARSVSAAENEAKAADDMFGQRSGLATAKGHTITRTAAIGPMVYSVERVLFNHIDRVITRVAYAQYARDVLRVLREPRIASEIDLRLGREYRDEIPLWLADQINVHPDVKAGDWAQWLMRYARQGIVAVGMGLRFTTGVAQVSGLMSSLGRLGGTQTPKLFYHVAQQVLTGVGAMAQGKRSALHDFVFERSEMMTRRMRENTVEVERVSKKLQGKHSWKDHVTAWMFWHIGMVDLHVVSIPTWITGYRKAIDQGMTEAQAATYADSMVVTSQGSGRTEHLARWQRSRSEGEKLFTMFYTPFNVIFNAQWEAARGVKRGDYTRAANLTFFFLMAQTTVDALLSGDLPGPSGDDDDDGLALDLVEWLMRNFAFGLFSGVPIARDAAAYGERQITGQYATFGGTPLGRIFEDMNRSAAALYKVEQGEKDFEPKMVPGIANAVGTVTHLPLGQPGQTTKFLWEYQRGDVQPQSIGDWYAGVTKGKIPEKKD